MSERERGHRGHQGGPYRENANERDDAVAALPRPAPVIDALGRPCPRCGGSLATSMEAGWFECHDCGGAFLEPCALEAFIAAAHEVPISPEARAARAKPEGFVVYLRCPVCEETMNRHNFAGASGVIVDRCTPHGTWFDRGELASARAYLARR